MMGSSYHRSTSEVIASRGYYDRIDDYDAPCRVVIVGRVCCDGKNGGRYSEASVHTRGRSYVPIPVIISSHIDACHPNPSIASQGDLESSLELPNPGFVRRRYVVLSESICFDYPYDRGASLSLGCIWVSC